MSVLQGEEIEKLMQVEKMFSRYHQERHKALELALAGKKEEAYFEKNAAGHVEHANGMLDEMADNEAKQAAERAEHSSQEASESA